MKKGGEEEGRERERERERERKRERERERRHRERSLFLTHPLSTNSFKSIIMVLSEVLEHDVVDTKRGRNMYKHMIVLLVLH